MEGYETDPTTYLMSSPVFEEGWYYIAIPMDGPQKDFGETYIWTPDTPGIRSSTAAVRAFFPSAQRE